MTCTSQPPIRLYVDEAISEDDSLVSLPLDTMQKLHLSHGDHVWIKGKKGRQTFSTAVAYDATTCDIEPKIRLNRVVMNDLFVKIGAFVSVHRPPDVTYREPLRLLSTDDNDDLKVSQFQNNVDHNNIMVMTEDYYCPRPFTLLFVRYYRYLYNDDDPHYFEPFCQVYSEESRIPHGKIPPIHLTFLPHPVAILASSDHLVLAASLEFEHIIQDARFVGPTKNYICNPLNKEWVELPMVIPPEYFAGYGFVCEPTSCKKQLGCTTNSRYRVVMIGLAHSDSNVHLGRRGLCMDNEFVTKVFCSEIGQWNEFVITYPQHKTVISKPRGWGPSRNRDLVVVASNGVLYWLEGLPFKGIVAFDPFNDIHTEQCRLIHLPTMCFKSTFYSTDTKLRLGVVNGQLRLSQLYKAETYFVFRVWELKNHHSESPSWVLVYNLKLRSSENELFVLSFHPNNTNVVFLLCGNNVCQYDISEKKYEKVGEHPGDYMDDPSVDIATFTLPHPSCPTMLPLSSN